MTAFARAPRVADDISKIFFSGLPRHNTGTECGLELIFISFVITLFTKRLLTSQVQLDIFPQHFHVCTNVVIFPYYMSPVPGPGTRPCDMSPQCVPHTFLSLQNIPATRPLVSGHLNKGPKIVSWGTPHLTNFGVDIKEFIRQV